MLYAFIDESYTANRYYVCAMIMDEQHLSALAETIDEGRMYARGFGITMPNIEYHAHSIMTGRDGWEPVRGQVRMALAIYRDILDRVARLPVSLIIRGVDVQRLNSRYRYPEPPHEVTLRHLLERIDMYAESAGDVVTVIADEVQGQAEHVARAISYQIDGTGGYRSRSLKTIIMPIVFASSVDSPGIQVADLCVYLYRRFDAHQETHARTARAVESLWESLAPIRHHVWRWDP